MTCGVDFAKYWTFFNDPKDNVCYDNEWTLLRSVHRERRENWIPCRHFHYLWIWNGCRWVWRPLPPPPPLTKSPKCRCRRKSATREFSFSVEQVGSEDPPPLRSQTSVPTFKSSSPVETGQLRFPCVTRTAAIIVFACSSNSCVCMARVAGRKVRLSPLNLEEMQSLLVLTSTTWIHWKLRWRVNCSRSLPIPVQCLVSYKLKLILNVVIVNESVQV